MDDRPVPIADPRDGDHRITPLQSVMVAHAPAVSGGHQGRQWIHVSLRESVCGPAVQMADQIADILIGIG